MRMTSKITTSRPMIPNPVPAMASSIRNLYPRGATAHHVSLLT
jgi:hypothetical protein